MHNSIIMRLLIAALGAVVAAGEGVVTPVTPGEVLVLTDSTFYDVTTEQLAAGKRLFVEFYAPWCGHCKRLEPIWTEFAGKVDENVVVAKMDATKNKAVPKTYGVKGFPTLVFLYGKELQPYKGQRDLAALLAYATEGYKTADGARTAPTPPAPPTALDEWLEKSTLGKDFNNIIKFEKGAAGRASVSARRVFRQRQSHPKTRAHTAAATRQPLHPVQVFSLAPGSLSASSSRCSCRAAAVAPRRSGTRTRRAWRPR